MVPMTKISLFYSLRLFLGLIGALCNTYLLRAVQRKFGSDTSQLLQLFFIVSPGMFISSTAFLPSTFAMFCYSAMLGAWLNGELVLALYLVSLAAVVAWPFSLLVGLPLAIYILVRKGVVFAVLHGFLSLVFFLAPSVIVDTFMYGRLVIAPAQIVLYNVFNQSGGPELYGVEPWYFYLINGFLNFNFILPLALVAPLLIIILAWKTNNFKAARDPLIMLTGAYLWLAYMSIIPHKEERFLFVIYPWICVAAALALSAISRIFIGIPKLIGMLIALALLVIVVLSVSRTASLYFNYEAPNALYTHLYQLETETKIEEKFEALKATLEAEDSAGFISNSASQLSLEERVRDWTRVSLFSQPSSNKFDSEGKPFEYVCVGKEWYRFASHFFLPSHMRLGFIKDGFDGQLPQYFGEGPTSTSRIPPHFNDLNREEPSRYMNLSDCKYWVEFFETQADVKAFEQSELQEKWQISFTAPFLSVANSPVSWARAFYIPTVSEVYNQFGTYALLRTRIPPASAN